MMMTCDHAWVPPRERVCPECLKEVDDRLEAIRVETEAFFNRTPDTGRLERALEALARIHEILSKEDGHAVSG